MTLCFQKKIPHKFWEIEYDGVLSSQVTCRIVTELLKFIVFERQQIPAPFEQLLQSQNEEEFSRKRIHSRKTGVSLNSKRKCHFVENFESVIRNLESAFKCCHKIEQILVLLGGTVVNPKEIYVIKLPTPGTYEGKLLNMKPCIRNFFRKIITSDLFGDLKLLPTTNLYVLIQAPRNAKIEWFLPKLTYNFKHPSRGRVLTLSISSNCIVHETELTLGNASAFEISGVEPLLDGTLDNGVNTSLYDNLSNLCINDGSTSDELSCENMAVQLLNNTTSNEIDDELIWFQAPVSVKGFKDKVTTKTSKATDIWG
ncbi:MAD2L1-binding protein-like [Tubulanus polymorphus]|uniref:MAD2L1-binding protein-like n=1 Tax=Tubulanus polymorphus TaxID=672921 RepID=UPI003DA48434